MGQKHHARAFGASQFVAGEMATGVRIVMIDDAGMVWLVAAELDVARDLYMMVISVSE